MIFIHSFYYQLNYILKFYIVEVLFNFFFINCKVKLLALIIKLFLLKFSLENSVIHSHSFSFDLVIPLIDITFLNPVLEGTSDDIKLIFLNVKNSLFNNSLLISFEFDKLSPLFKSSGHVDTVKSCKIIRQYSLSLLCQSLLSLLNFKLWVYFNLI